MLTLDQFMTDSSHLQVIDILSKDSLMELDLGNNAAKFFLSNGGDITIGYTQMRTTLNPITLDKKYTTHGENTEPLFISVTIPLLIHWKVIFLKNRNFFKYIGCQRCMILRRTKRSSITLRIF